MAASTTVPVTEFAPAERVPIEIVERQAASVDGIPLAAKLLNSVFNFVLILNAQRQIIFSNDNFLNLTTEKDHRRILGLRPGEALGCVHSHEHEGGCGTAVFCSECGAVGAVLTALAGRAEIREYRLTRLIGCGQEALDLLVAATPFEYRGERFCIVAVADISQEKRRQALERAFFHDLINSAGSLEGLMECLCSEAPARLRPNLELAATGFRGLLEQVYAQRDLAAAEQGELTVSFGPLNSKELLRQLADFYRHHPVASERCLCLDPNAAELEFDSDQVLLRRVLGNLIKNALEAAPPGGTVILGCDAAGQQVRLWVRNPGFISRNVQLQLFSRSFTTKGKGRGLGTYSAKLLTERYLRGAIAFASSPEDDTTFFVLLPRQLHG
jgi:signal transduction histidine kinase